MKYIFKFLLVVAICNYLVAEDEIEGLLLKIERKTDLSSKTKLENSGVRTIYTRDELNRMQIHFLKDILKVLYPINYRENYFGIADPYNPNIKIPFMSGSIKLYIDDQEILDGIYGSGLSIYGNIDIDFVDHIEIYFGSPTYQYSTEPAVMLIKLYSKIAQKDEGSKISAFLGSYGANGINFYNSKELDDWSYFAYVSKINQKRKKYNSFNTSLSKNRKITHLFGSFYKKNNKFLLDYITNKGDGFIGPSIDATPIKNEFEYNTLHFGYNLKKDKFSYLLTYDGVTLKYNFLDDTNLTNKINSLIVKSISDTYTTGIKYNNKFNKNDIVLGINYRSKAFKYPTFVRNGSLEPQNYFRYQKIATFYAENQYHIKNSSILTTGISFTKVKNTHSIQQDDLFMYRLGYTHTTNNWVFKTIHSHFEISLEPYLINNKIFLINPNKKYNKTKQNFFIEDIIYKKNDDKFELIASYATTKNQMLTYKIPAKLDNYPNTITVKDIAFKYTKTYNDFNILYIMFRNSQISNFPNLDTANQYTGEIKSIISYKKFDIFNELVYSKDDVSKKNFYDYSAGVKYNYTKNLSISLKGTNLLNKGKKEQFIRIDPNTLKLQSPIEAANFDRKIILRVEYLF